MAGFLKTFLVIAYAAGVFAAQPAVADVIIKPSSTPTKDVVIHQGNNTLIMRTSPGAAARIQKMINNSDRVIIRSYNGRPYDYSYYPENYYPYYRNNGAAYSLGYALGRKND